VVALGRIDAIGLHIAASDGVPECHFQNLRPGGFDPSLTSL
jgi:hypothetical protein